MLTVGYVEATECVSRSVVLVASSLQESVLLLVTSTFSCKVWTHSWLFCCHTFIFLQHLVLKHVQTCIQWLKRIWSLFSCRIHLGITTDVLLRGFDCLVLVRIFFCIPPPHFLLLCVTVITFIFEYELKIPLFQFSLFFSSELIPSRSLYLSCHCQCLLSCRVWFQLQSQRRNAYALLPLFSPPSAPLPLSFLT